MKKSMKENFLMLVAALVALSFVPLTVSCADEKAAPKAETQKVDINNPLAFLPDVVATVGDTKITKKDVEEEAKLFINMAKTQQSPEAMELSMWKSLAAEITQNLVEQTLLTQLAKADGIVSDPKSVDQVLEEMRGKDPAKFDEMIKAQGLTMDDVKKRIATGTLIRDWFQKKVIPGITDAEIEKFYQENREMMKTQDSVNASHILITPEKKSEEDLAKMSEEEKTKSADEAKKAAHKKAEEILAKVKQGEDFGKLAAENSMCPSGKSAAGSLGDFTKGQMVKEFEDSVFGLKDGEISGVVDTEFGSHIIKRNSHKEAGFTPLAEVKEQIQQKLASDKIAKIMDDQKANKKVQMFIEVDKRPEEMPMPPQ